MYDDFQLKKIFASVLIISLGLLLIYAVLPYISAVFGSIVLYIILRPIYLRLNRNHNISPQVSAFIAIIFSIFVILIPLSFVLGAAYAELNQISKNPEVAGNLVGYTQKISDLVPGIDLAQVTDQAIGKIGSAAGNLIFSTFSNVFGLVLNLILMYFMLYYLLTSDRQALEKLYSLSPFNKAHTKQLMLEFGNITKVSIVASGFIAILQGTAIALAFMAFNIPGAFFWGVIAAALSFLPLLGPHLIWIPVVIIKFLMQDYFAAGVFLVIGVIISSSDSFIRPMLQNQFGKVHPLTSLMGVLIGVPLFGLFGIIIGPLMISYTILMIKMYREEYLEGEEIVPPKKGLSKYEKYKTTTSPSRLSLR